MNRAFFAKNKKIILISLGVVVIALLFFIKTSSNYKNSPEKQAGLVYADETVGELVNKDTDGDGVPDWEESLYGTDPTKPDTDGDGIGDAQEIEQIQVSKGVNTDSGTAAPENLTETEKFSRQLFSTVTALNQTGGLDQNTVDQLSTSLANEVNNPSVQNAYSTSNIKTSGDTGTDAARGYDGVLEGTLKKYSGLYDGSTVIPLAQTFGNALQSYLGSGNDSAMSKLDQPAKDLRAMTVALGKMIVPSEFADAHVALMNQLEWMAENLSNTKEVGTDPVTAYGAISNFSQNIQNLQGAIDKLHNAINQKIKN